MKFIVFFLMGKGEVDRLECKPELIPQKGCEIMLSEKKLYNVDSITYDYGAKGITVFIS